MTSLTSNITSSRMSTSQLVSVSFDGSNMFESLKYNLLFLTSLFNGNWWHKDIMKELPGNKLFLLVEQRLVLDLVYLQAKIWFRYYWNNFIKLTFGSGMTGSLLASLFISAMRPTAPFAGSGVTRSEVSRSRDRSRRLRRSRDLDRDRRRDGAFSTTVTRSLFPAKSKRSSSLKEKIKLHE